MYSLPPRPARLSVVVLVGWYGTHLVSPPRAIYLFLQSFT